MSHAISALDARQLPAGSPRCASWGNEAVTNWARSAEHPSAMLFFEPGCFALRVSLGQFSGFNALAVARLPCVKLRLKDNM